MSWVVISFGKEMSVSLGKLLESSELADSIQTDKGHQGKINWDLGRGNGKKHQRATWDFLGFHV
jgi:hypothetical protein